MANEALENNNRLPTINDLHSSPGLIARNEVIDRLLIVRFINYSLLLDILLERKPLVVAPIKLVPNQN
tara:strand:+ start:227 stop:430 length:204 start_codon:yes stop_codon:yes gene_type:complete